MSDRFIGLALSPCGRLTVGILSHRLRLRHEQADGETTMIDRVLDLPMEEIAALCRRYGVQELSMFGSALRDDFCDDSDFDFLVLFQPDAQIGFMEFAGLQHELADVLGREVDFGSKRALKPTIRDEVLASARVVYAAE